MPTTSNFGWTTPADTDLVKDGAAAIRTLGNGIDASLLDLKGGTTGQILSKASNTDLDYTWINNDQGDITEVVAGTGISGGGTSGSVTVTNSMATTIDAKGDLIAGTADNAFARLAVGANNTVLTADSTTATGLKWAALTTDESWSLLNTGGTALTGAATITVSGISGKSRILVVVSEGGTANISSQIQLRINADSTTKYNQRGSTFIKSSTYSAASSYGGLWTNNGNFVIGTMASSISTGKLTSSILLSNCNSTSYKIAQFTGGAHETGTGGYMEIAQGFYTGTSTISSISIISNSGNFDEGTVFVYAA